MSTSYVPQWLRERVAEQARRRCGYCLSAEAVVGAAMEVDHIIPESLGGETEQDNLWLACAPCNTYKSNRIAAVDPVTGDVVRLFNPRRQDWADHFRWTESGEVILMTARRGLRGCRRWRERS